MFLILLLLLNLEHTTNTLNDFCPAFNSIRLMAALTDQGSRVMEDEPLTQHRFNEQLDEQLVQLHREHTALVRQQHDRDNDPHSDKLDDFYQIPHTVEMLHRYSTHCGGVLNNVALQFPDDLLPDAARVCKRMQALLMLLEWKKLETPASSSETAVSGVVYNRGIDDAADDAAADGNGGTTHVVDIEDTIGLGGDAGSGSDGMEEETPSTAEKNHASHALHLTSEEIKSRVAADGARGIPEVYVLGDTSYSSCCVDEIAAQHVDADFIIHYGNACLQPVKRTPVHHVFGKSYSIDIEMCAASLREYAEGSGEDTVGGLPAIVVVLYDLTYHRTVQELESRMTDNKRIIFSHVDPTRVTQNVDDLAALGITIDDSSNSSSACDTVPTPSELSFKTHEVNGLRFEIPLVKAQSSGESDYSTGDQEAQEHPYKFFYIGEDSIRLTQLMMDYSFRKCARYSGASNSFDDGSFASSRVQRLLKKRYFMMHQSMEAQVFGIIVATTSVANYMDILKYTQDLIKSRGKKSYVFYVGKLNVPKLANFAEVDAFVLISCNQNSLIDSKEFFKPIVTPFELEIALKRFVTASVSFKKW